MHFHKYIVLMTWNIGKWQNCSLLCCWGRIYWSSCPSFKCRSWSLHCRWCKYIQLTMGLDTELNMAFITQDGIKAVDVALIKEHPKMYQLLASVSEQLTVSFSDLKLGSTGIFIPLFRVWLHYLCHQQWKWNIQNHLFLHQCSCCKLLRILYLYSSCLSTCPPPPRQKRIHQVNNLCNQLSVECHSVKFLNSLWSSFRLDSSSRLVHA